MRALQTAIALSALLCVACVEDPVAVNGDAGAGGTGGMAPDGPGGTGGAGEDPEGPGGCTSTDDYIAQTVWPELLEPVCSICHVAGGPAGHTDLILEAPLDAAALGRTRDALTTVADRLVEKPSGQHLDGHGGGILIAPTSPEAVMLHGLVGRLTGVRDDCGRLVDGEDEPPLVPADCAQPPLGRRSLRRLSHHEFAATIADLLGLEVDAQAEFAADRVVEGYANHGPSLTVTGLLADQYRTLAERLADEVELARILPCGGADRDCAGRFVVEFGLRLFRRPLTGVEAGRYLAIYDLAADQGFEAAIRWTLGAMLQSPHFLYRTELGRRTAEGDFALTSYELATALSYLIWQTTPDATLLDQAASGALLEPATLQAELQRLLADPRSAETQVRFVERWLSLDQLAVVSREGLPDDVRRAMAEQTAAVVAELWAEGGDLATLLTTDRTWMPRALAEHLGLDGEGWVDLSQTPYAGGGVLAHAGVLTTHAKPADSSPIHRGLLVRERFLCQPLPDPPANLDTSPPAVDPSLSTRERYTRHSSDPACSGCHRLVDPIGFALEHFDGLGRHRETDGEHAIDASGTIIGEPEEDIDGLAGLAGALAVRADVAHCYAEQWLRFGMGIGGEAPLECYTTHVAADVETLADAIPAIAALPTFTRRVGGDAELDVPGAELTPSAPGEMVEQPEPIEPPDDPGPAPADGVTPGAMLTLTETSRWGEGYCVNAVVVNASDAELTWVVAHDFEGTVNNMWNAVADADSGSALIRGVEWNSTLPPGAQADFGWCAELP